MVSAGVGGFVLLGLGNGIGFIDTLVSIGVVICYAALDRRVPEPGGPQGVCLVVQVAGLAVFGLDCAPCLLYIEQFSSPLWLHVLLQTPSSHGKHFYVQATTSGKP